MKKMIICLGLVLISSRAFSGGEYGQITTTDCSQVRPLLKRDIELLHNQYEAHSYFINSVLPAINKIKPVLDESRIAYYETSEKNIHETAFLNQHRSWTFNRFFRKTALGSMYYTNGNRQNFAVNLISIASGYEFAGEQISNQLSRLQKIMLYDKDIQRLLTGPAECSYSTGYNSQGADEKKQIYYDIKMEFGNKIIGLIGRSKFFYIKSKSGDFIDAVALDNDTSSVYHYLTFKTFNFAKINHQFYKNFEKEVQSRLNDYNELRSFFNGLKDGIADLSLRERYLTLLIENMTPRLIVINDDIAEVKPGKKNPLTYLGSFPDFTGPLGSENLKMFITEFSNDKAYVELVKIFENHFFKPLIEEEANFTKQLPNLIRVQNQLRILEDKYYSIDSDKAVSMRP